MFFKFVYLNAVVKTLTEFELYNGKIKLCIPSIPCLILDYFRFLNICFYDLFCSFIFFLICFLCTEAPCLFIFFMIIILIIINFFSFYYYYYYYFLLMFSSPFLNFLLLRIVLCIPEAFYLPLRK